MDYGANRVCIIRHFEGKDLTWRQGGKSWGDRMSGYVTMPAALLLIDPGSIAGKMLHEGGRLGHPTLSLPAVRDRITAAFGDEAFARLSKMNLRKETLYIEP